MGYNAHPKQTVKECEEAERRIVEAIRPKYDEWVLLRYRATNAEPFLFEWVNKEATELDYAAVLTRISRRYDQRFGRGNVERAADRSGDT